MLYGVHITADAYYTIEADNEDEAADIATDYFDKDFPLDYEIEEFFDD